MNYYVPEGLRTIYKLERKTKSVILLGEKHSIKYLCDDDYEQKSIEKILRTLLEEEKNFDIFLETPFDLKYYERVRHGTLYERLKYTLKNENRLHRIDIRFSENIDVIFMSSALKYIYSRNITEFPTTLDKNDYIFFIETVCQKDVDTVSDLFKLTNQLNKMEDEYQMPYAACVTRSLEAFRPDPILVEKYVKEIDNPSKAYNEVVKNMHNRMSQYLSVIVDLYTVGRLLKSYINKCVIYVGEFHCHDIANILQTIGFGVTYLKSYLNNNHCFKMDNIHFKNEKGGYYTFVKLMESTPSDDSGYPMKKLINNQILAKHVKKNFLIVYRNGVVQELETCRACEVYIRETETRYLKTVIYDP